MATTYDVGDVARLSAAFTQTAVAVDPSTVALTVLTPAAASTTYTYGVDGALVKDSTGIYHLDLAIAAAGRYRWRWVSTGTGASAGESWLMVRARDVP